MGVWKFLFTVFACKLLFPGEAEVYYWNDNNNWGSQEAEDVIKMIGTWNVQKVLGHVEYVFKHVNQKDECDLHCSPEIILHHSFHVMLQPLIPLP